MNKDNEAQLRYSCRFDEKDGSYYLRLNLCQEKGRHGSGSWHKNIDAVVISPYFKVNPLRSGFVPDEDGYKTEKEFRLVPKNHQNVGRIEVLLLVGNQAIYNHSFEDISQLLL